MKKIFFAFLALLAIPGYSQWVLLTQLEETSVPEVDILDFTTSDYNDYIFVINGIAASNSAYNVLIQVGFDDGVHPVQWVNSYAGGVSSIRSGQTSFVSTTATSLGIPVTNVANQGGSFVGDLRISNTGAASDSNPSISYGPVAVYGQGTFGVDGSGFVSGTLNGTGKVNCVRFISADPAAGATAISTATVAVYGLARTM